MNKIFRSMTGFTMWKLNYPRPKRNTFQSCRTNFYWTKYYFKTKPAITAPGNTANDYVHVPEDRILDPIPQAVTVLHASCVYEIPVTYSIHIFNVSLLLVSDSLSVFPNSPVYTQRFHRELMKYAIHQPTLRSYTHTKY